MKIAIDGPAGAGKSTISKEVAKKLAYVGSVRDEILDFGELAYELIKLLNKLYQTAVENRYNGAKTLEDIALVRKYVLPGGEVDYDRTAKMIVDDFRKGRLGKITLD